MHILFLPVICSLALPLYDWYCSPCCKQSPLNSIEALQENSRTYTNCLFLVTFLQPGLLSPFQGNILSWQKSSEKFCVSQDVPCNKGAFMKCLSGCQVLEVVVQKPQILDCQWGRCDPPWIVSAAHSSVSYHMDLSGFMFIPGWSKLG